MDLEIAWKEPVVLREGKTGEGLIYTCDPEELPDDPGIYVFCRAYGDGLDPLYIGKADNIRKRVGQHFKNNVRLMMGVRDYDKSGRRMVVPGCWISKSGQQQNKVLLIIERALIRYAMAEGYDILNKSGTRIRAHNLSMSGNRSAVRVFSRTMLINK